MAHRGHSTSSRWLLVIALGVSILAACNKEATSDQAYLLKKVSVPKRFLTEGPEGIVFGGDIRVGDLSGNQQLDFLVYRSEDDAHDGGGMKPCFLGAFDIDGNILWQHGEGGSQPSRPGPVAIHDIDGDGDTEVIHFWLNSEIDCPPTSMRNVVIQIRDGKTGVVEKESTPDELMIAEGQGANWVHQRLLICNLRGTDSPRDFIVKLGKKVLAFDEDLKVLWTYINPWDEYTKCPAYIPSVGDIDEDGKDEINGGYFLLDDDGSVMWEEQLGHNMDSVTIAPWDEGNMRAFGSGFGHVVDETGNILLKLGEKLVPHGQELRVAQFDPTVPGPQMAIRYEGHKPPVMIVDVNGNVIRRFNLNKSPNNTGMEAIFWNSPKKPALLYNGGLLWKGDGTMFAELPDLPPPQGTKRRGWYHCVPADLSNDEGEEVIIYNPWDSFISIYGQHTFNRWKSYEATPRQYNVRLMD